MADPFLTQFGFEPAATQGAPQAQPQQTQEAAPEAASTTSDVAIGKRGDYTFYVPGPNLNEAAYQNQAILGRLGKVASDVATGVTEAPTAIAHGVTKAANAVSDAAFDLASFADRWAPLGQFAITRDGFKWDRKAGMPESNQLKVDNPFPEPTSVTGGMVDGAAQFIAAYALGGKLLKLARGGTVAATTAGRLAEAGVKTAFAGAAGFDPSEDRLSNLIQESPMFANPINEFLASSPDDSRAVGRFKNALEQLAVNMPLEGIFYAVRGLKAKRAGDLEKAESDARAAERAFMSWREAAAKSKGEVLDTGGTGKSPPDPLDLNALEAVQQTGMHGIPGEVLVDGTTPQATKVNKQATEADTAAPAAPKYVAPKFDQQNLLDTFALASGNGSNVDTFAGSIVGKNMARVNNENDAKAFFNTLGTIEAERFAKAKGRPRTLAETEAAAEDSFQKLADYTGTDVGQLRIRMAADVKNLDELADRVAGYRMGVEVYSKRAAELARAIIKGDASEFGGQVPALQAEFLKTAQTLLAIAPLSEGVKSGLGRNLSLLRAKVGPGEHPVGPLPAEGDAAAAKAATPDAANAAMQSDLSKALQGNEAFVQSLAKKLSLADNPKVAKKIVDDAFGPGVFDVVNEYWINALLSGPKTHVVNMMTSTLKSALVMPTEQLVAGMLQADHASMRMALDQYVGFYLSMRDALKLSARAMKDGDAVLDPTHQGMGQSRYAITADTFGLDTSTPLGMLVDGLGTIARLPGRLLTTEDELLKQLNYRARLYTLGMRELREMKAKHSISDKDAAEFMAEYMERGFDANGRAVNEEALAYARDATFTNDLDVPSSGRKSIGEAVNEMANNHPAMRMILPFTRVPTNILRDAWDHTPGLNLLRKAYREELNAGGERRAIASAKMTTGGALWAAAIMMAANGDITGPLSSDPTTRKLELDAGKIPNAFRFYDENGKPYYIEYGRFDPYATFFSIAATVAEASGHMNDWQLEDLAGSLAVGLAKNIESKTYLQGLMNWMGALSDPDRRAPGMVRQFAGSFVPSLTNTFKGADYLSDARTISEAMLARTPGHGLVDKRYNILGEPVKVPGAFGPDWLSPFAMAGADRYDPVLAEIAKQAQIHKGGIAYPSKKRELGGDLTEINLGDKTGYARFQELVGEARISGMTLRDRLTALFNSPIYKDKLTDGEPGFEGSRMWEIDRTFGEYRRAAEQLLRRESPEFNAKYIADDRHKTNNMRFGKQP